MKKIISILAVFILIVACNKSSTPAIIPPLVDIDRNVYDTLKIGTQTWMKQNLKTSRYRNGDPIPNVTDPTAWGALTTGAWCWYNNDPANEATYGKLYNWYAVNDPRGLAPAGWHVPSDAEWTTLSTGLGDDGGAMKETGTTQWLTPNTGATNSSGFTGLPGGGRSNSGAFSIIGHFGYWWSSTENNAAFAWNRILIYNNDVISRGFYIKPNGHSVRCLKD